MAHGMSAAGAEVGRISTASASDLVAMLRRHYLADSSRRLLEPIVRVSSDLSKLAGREGS